MPLPAALGKTARAILASLLEIADCARMAFHPGAIGDLRGRDAVRAIPRVHGWSYSTGALARYRAPTGVSVRIRSLRTETPVRVDSKYVKALIDVIPAFAGMTETQLIGVSFAARGPRQPRGMEDSSFFV